MVHDAPAPAAAAIVALRDDGSLDPAHAGGVGDELSVALYEHMVLSRALDERAVGLQRDGAIARHASALGDEAAVLGAASAMHDDDWLFPGRADFAAALWRGMPLVAYAHHLFGDGRDVAHGRNAPDPAFWSAARVASASPLPGRSVPHAVGAAWAARVAKREAAALLFVDPGAVDAGDFHAALNFAGVTRAPLVALCRCRDGGGASFAGRAVAYGLRGVCVDGTDLWAVRSVVQAARAQAVAGQGATLVEAVSPGRDRADPLARTRRHLEARGLWDAAREERLAAEAKADVDRAIAEAASAPAPAPDTLFSDVFAPRREARP